MQRWIFLWIVWLSVSCSNKTVMVPNPTVPISFGYSQANIPLDFQLPALETEINRQLDSLMGTFRELDVTGLGKVKLEVRKTSRAIFDFRNNEIHFSLPVSFRVSKNLGITKLNSFGTIYLEFATPLEIARDWRMVTHTRIEKYEWREKPVLEGLGIQVSVKGLLDNFIQRYRKEFLGNIDKSLYDAMNIREILQPLWKELFMPRRLEGGYEAWFTMEPGDISLSGFSRQGSHLSTQFGMQIKPQIGFSVPSGDQFLLKPIPPLNLSTNLVPGLDLKVLLTLPYNNLENILLGNLKGQTFSNGGFSVTVEGLQIIRINTTLGIGLDLSGNFSGRLWLYSVPIYENNLFQLENFDYKAEGKQFLLKNFKFLIKGPMKKKLESEINLRLSDMMEEVRNQLNSSLQESVRVQGQEVNGGVNTVSILQSVIRSQDMQFLIGVNGDPRIILKRFS